jgi:hypothetical protein
VLIRRLKKQIGIHWPTRSEDVSNKNLFFIGQRSMIFSDDIGEMTTLSETNVLLILVELLIITV